MNTLTSGELISNPDSPALKSLRARRLGWLVGREPSRLTRREVLMNQNLPNVFELEEVDAVLRAFPDIHRLSAPAITVLNRKNMEGYQGVRNKWQYRSAIRALPDVLFGHTTQADTFGNKEKLASIAFHIDNRGAYRLENDQRQALGALGLPLSPEGRPHVSIARTRDYDQAEACAAAINTVLAETFKPIYVPITFGEAHISREA